MAANAEQKKALFYSLGLHLVLVLMLFISVKPEPITLPKGSAIMAEIMELPAKKLAPSNKLTKVEPKPKPEPEIIEPEPEPEIIEPDPEPEVINPEPEPKPEIKPEPPKPDPDVIKRQQQQTERLEKLKQLREQRKVAEQAAAEQKNAAVTPVKESAEEPEEAATGPLGNPNGDASQERTLLTQYITSIQSAVTRQWSRPVGTEAGLTCQIKVNQIPGGGVIDVSIGSPCNANTVVKNSIINAVKKADPLPYTGFESVFERRLNFIFQYQGD